MFFRECPCDLFESCESRESCQWCDSSELCELYELSDLFSVPGFSECEVCSCECDLRES